MGTGAIAAGGVLGILIPPSVILIIYSVIVEANIVTMFAAALVPGLIAVALFIVTILVYVTIFPDAGPKGALPERGELIAATLGILPVALVFGVVIGGIYLGFFNPTPAAAAGAVMVALFGVAKGRLSLADSRAACWRTARTAGMIYLILLGAGAPEDLHVPRRRAPSDGRVDGRFRPAPDDDPDPPAGGADRAGMPDGQPVDDSCWRSRSSGRCWSS